MEIKRKTEIDDIERRKTEHIRELMSEHDKAFQDIREYYNDITSNNLELIKNLKVTTLPQPCSLTHPEQGWWVVVCLEVCMYKRWP